MLCVRAHVWNTRRPRADHLTDLCQSRPCPPVWLAPSDTWAHSSSWYLYTYNEFAFKVLGLVSPVAQAVGNTVKRVVILVATAIAFGTPMTPIGLPQTRVYCRWLPLPLYPVPLISVAVAFCVCEIITWRHAKDGRGKVGSHARTLAQASRARRSRWWAF